MIHGYNDSNKSKVEVLSKEQLYTVLNQLIQGGELPSVDEDTAFVTMLKSIVDGGTYKIGFCTQAQFNQLERAGELEANAYYIIIDDDSYETLSQSVSDLINDCDELDSRINILDTDFRALESKDKVVGTDAFTANIINRGNEIELNIYVNGVKLSAISLTYNDVQLMFGASQISVKNRLSRTLKLKSELKAINSFTHDDVNKYHRVERQSGDMFYPCQLIWDNDTDTMMCYYFDGNTFTRVQKTNVICYYYSYE